MVYKFDRELRARCIDVFERHYGVVLTPEEADEILQDLANLSILLSKTDECSDNSCGHGA